MCRWDAVPDLARYGPPMRVDGHDLARLQGGLGRGEFGPEVVFAGAQLGRPGPSGAAGRGCARPSGTATLAKDVPSRPSLGYRSPAGSARLISCGRVRTGSTAIMPHGEERWRTTMPETVAADEVISHLEDLAADLKGRGFTATVTSDGRYPFVRVVNSTAAQLSEQVYAALAADGSVWFWWSWAERIAPIQEPAAAAAKIAHVLAAAAGSGRS